MPFGTYTGAGRTIARQVKLSPNARYRMTVLDRGSDGLTRDDGRPARFRMCHGNVGGNDCIAANQAGSDSVVICDGSGNFNLARSITCFVDEFTGAPTSRPSKDPAAVPPTYSPFAVPLFIEIFDDDRRRPTRRPTQRPTDEPTYEPSGSPVTLSPTVEYTEEPTREKVGGSISRPEIFDISPTTLQPTTATASPAKTAPTAFLSRDVTKGPSYGTKSPSGFWIDTDAATRQAGDDREESGGMLPGRALGGGAVVLAVLSAWLI